MAGPLQAQKGAKQRISGYIRSKIPCRAYISVLYSDRIIAVCRMVLLWGSLMRHPMMQFGAQLVRASQTVGQRRGLLGEDTHYNQLYTAVILALFAVASVCDNNVAFA